MNPGTPQTSQSMDSLNTYGPAILDQHHCTHWLHRHKPEAWGPGLHQADSLEGRQIINKQTDRISVMKINTVM